MMAAMMPPTARIIKRRIYGEKYARA